MAAEHSHRVGPHCRSTSGAAAGGGGAAARALRAPAACAGGGRCCGAKRGAEALGEPGVGLIASWAPTSRALGPVLHDAGTANHLCLQTYAATGVPRVCRIGPCCPGGSKRMPRVRARPLEKPEPSLAAAACVPYCMSVALPAHALLLGFAEQVREGKVMNVSAKEAGNMLNDGWVLLDVRPPNEIAKARRGAAAPPSRAAPPAARPRPRRCPQLACPAGKEPRCCIHATICMAASCAPGPLVPSTCLRADPPAACRPSWWARWRCRCLWWMTRCPSPTCSSRCAPWAAPQHPAAPPARPRQRGPGTRSLWMGWGGTSPSKPRLWAAPLLLLYGSVCRCALAQHCPAGGAQLPAG